MSESLVVSPLAQHREYLPLLASWFLQEWPAWYGQADRGNATNDLRTFAASETALPTGLIVFREGQPIGVGALKAESFPTHKHLCPWAAAGFVLPAHRGHGVGAALLQGLAQKAWALGYSHIYCGTTTSASLPRRCGWAELERIEHEGKSLAIFEKAAA